MMRFLGILFFTYLTTYQVYANPLTQNQPNFIVKKACQQLDQINLQLSVQNLDLHNLTAAVNTLSALSKNAEDCIDDGKDKLNNIDDLLKQSKDPVTTNTPTADFVYLSKEQKKLADKQAQCRLFLIRAKESISIYKTAIAKMKQEATLERTIPLWKQISQIVSLAPNTALINTSKITFPPVLQSVLVWGILLALTLAGSFFLLSKVRKSPFVHRHFRPEKIRLSITMLTACLLFIVFLLTYLFINSGDVDEASHLLVSISPALYYFLVILLVLFVFKLKKIKTFFSWYHLNPPFFKSLILWFSSLYLLKLMDSVLFDMFQVHALLRELIQAFYLLLVIGFEIYFINRFCLIHPAVQFVKHHHRLIRRVSTSLLLACAVIEILGYHALALRLTYSGLITFAILFIMILGVQGANKLYLSFSDNPTHKRFIMHQFGYKENQTLVEFLILKITVQLIIVGTGLFFISKHWEFATDYADVFSAGFLNGIHFANLTLYPTRLISGVIVFCLLYLIFRFISTSISKKQQFEQEEDTQVAIASIFTYLGFALAAIGGLLVSGFDFTALAIVAGALSVGIGLGLQSIVNNFVSGLIILIEKPIKPGDRILIDGIEGFVKKISVRSTLILTPSREDIIIPNSDLITHRVTNYTYNDRYLSIHCDVKVMFNSDIQLVSELLLQAANSHEEVINNTRNKPSVLFASCDEKTLVFQLWCLIKDANKKSQVQSELYFAIHGLLIQHQINRI